MKSGLTDLEVAIILKGIEVYNIHLGGYYCFLLVVVVASN